MFEKVTHFFFYHMNYYTAILVNYLILYLCCIPYFRTNYSFLQLCFTVWFVYHVDIDDDLLW